jgi:hypothetical protein
MKRSYERKVGGKERMREEWEKVRRKENVMLPRAIRALGIIFY